VVIHVPTVNGIEFWPIAIDLTHARHVATEVLLRLGREFRAARTAAQRRSFLATTPQMDRQTCRRE